MRVSLLVNTFSRNSCPKSSNKAILRGCPLEAAPGMNSIYGNACSVGQEIVSLGEGYGFRNPENSFRINPVSFWSLGYEGFSFGEHFQQEFMSQKF